MADAWHSSLLLNAFQISFILSLNEAERQHEVSLRSKERRVSDTRVRRYLILVLDSLF